MVGPAAANHRKALLPTMKAPTCPPTCGPDWLCCPVTVPPAYVSRDVRFDCGWSLLNHGVADTKRLNLGNLNPIYERELIKLELHQGEGR